MKISDYPFAEEAADYVRRTGYSLESLVEKNSFRSVRSRAIERVEGAISGDIQDRQTSNDAALLAELLSYPMARVMISCLGDQLLVRRYALAEAKLAYSRMRKDPESILPMAEDLGIHPQGKDDPLRIHFSEYIRAAHRMRNPKWKLVNRDLMEGYLTITREELMRLMEEMVRDKVMKGLPLEVDEATCKKLAEYTAPIKSELEILKARQKVDLGKIEEGAFPPCIKSMLSQVSVGINLAHSARFALTSFLLQINMPVDDVIGLFNTSPDFDEERTRYQVEHIAGASGTKYKPPSCATMTTYGNCPGEDELCKRIRHPLGYYERRIRYDKNKNTKMIT